MLKSWWAIFTISPKFNKVTHSHLIWDLRNISAAFPEIITIIKWDLNWTPKFKYFLDFGFPANFGENLSRSRPWKGSHWLVGRVSGEGGRGVKKTGCLLECQSEEQEVWHVRVDFNKVTDKRRSSVSSVKRGRYVGTRRFRVRGQRTPEVNKVALTALKYFIALIAATLIAQINALTLTALFKIHTF